MFLKSKIGLNEIKKIIKSIAFAHLYIWLIIPTLSNTQITDWFPVKIHIEHEYSKLMMHLLSNNVADNGDKHK